MAEAFPKSLEEFGYVFNADGRLRELDTNTGLETDKGFQFNVSEDPEYNQKRYEALGEIITEYVYNLLHQEGLNKLSVPKKNNTPLASRSFIFSSKDAMENEKLILLIHGSGVVRAGQWARRLIINDCLSNGTQIPYIKMIKKLGYGLLVLNTNDNYRTVGSKTFKIEGSGDPHEHFETVWRDYVQPAKAKYVAIIAHSYGGECTVQFARKYPEEFRKKVFAVALTDSVHVAPRTGLGYVSEITRNWSCSDKPLDAPLPTMNKHVERVSAGHTIHEMASSSCIESVFCFIEELYKMARTNMFFNSFKE